MAKRLSDNIRSEIVSRYNSGKRASVLAADFSISETTVRNMVREAGGQACHVIQVSSERCVEILDLYRRGFSLRQIGGRLNIPKGTVCGIVARAGIQRPKVKTFSLTQEQSAALAQEYLGGKTYVDLATKYKIAPTTVGEVLRRMSVEPRIGWASYRTQPWMDRRGRSVLFKSSWELAYARWMDAQGWDWSYEPVSFYVPGSRRYTPDFGIYEGGVLIGFVEVKGWLDEKTKRRLEKFRAAYPQVIVELVGAGDLAALGLVETKYLNHHMAAAVESTRDELFGGQPRREPGLQSIEMTREHETWTH